jgi:hypothetical protein
MNVNVRMRVRVYACSGARPIASADDPNILTCPADCRLLVFPSLSSSHHFWLKVSI